MRPHLPALAFLAASAAASAAQEATPGRDLYAYYCAYCHGDGGAGDGTLARFLTIPVADLTGLSARNGGVFPMLDVVHRLDGTRQDMLHGGPMPVFGPLFDDETAGYGDDTAAILDRNGRILTLTLYLETLQRP